MGDFSDLVMVIVCGGTTDEEELPSFRTLDGMRAIQEVLLHQTGYYHLQSHYWTVWES